MEDQQIEPSSPARPRQDHRFAEALSENATLAPLGVAPKASCQEHEPNGSAGERQVA
jgi:hypothetical protein